MVWTTNLNVIIGSENHNGFCSSSKSPLMKAIEDISIENVWLQLIFLILPTPPPPQTESCALG